MWPRVAVWCQCFRWCRSSRGWYPHRGGTLLAGLHVVELLGWRYFFRRRWWQYGASVLIGSAEQAIIVTSHSGIRIELMAFCWPRWCSCCGERDIVAVRFASALVRGVFAIERGDLTIVEIHGNHLFTINLSHQILIHHPRYMVRPKYEVSEGGETRQVVD